MEKKDDKYKDQERLDKKLIQLGVVRSSGEQHMSINEFNGKLATLNKEIKGYRIYSI